MNAVKVYYNICKELEMLDDRMKDLQREREYYKRMAFNLPKSPGAVDFTQERVTSSPAHMSLDRIWDNVNRIDVEIQETERMINFKKQTKAIIERTIRECDGLEYKVAHMFYVEGKPLYQIADELGYSYDWIKKVSSKISKNVRKKALVRH